LRGNKILVVDDEPNIVRSLAFVFNKEGYQVSIAENGEEAMEMIRGSKPDILILDVMMPHKNGYDVCQEIKSDPGLKDIHVLMLTAKGQKGDREAALARGADEYISKPFSPIQVLDRVKELLT